LYSTLFSQGGLGGVPKCDPLTECRDGISLPNKADIVAVPNCPTIAIQNCIQENILAIGGPVSGLNNENTQNMNCTQNISDSTKLFKNVFTDFLCGIEKVAKEDLKMHKLTTETFIAVLGGYALLVKETRKAYFDREDRNTPTKGEAI
jgi:hypothetical protein